MEELNVLNIIVMVTSISILISGFERLSLYREYKDTGLFSWRVNRTKAIFVRYKRLQKIADIFFSYPNVLLLIAIKTIAAFFVLLFWGNYTVLAIACGLISLISIILKFRGFSGLTGADQFLKIVFITSTIAFLSSSHVIWMACLLFISAQLCIHYMTSGWIRIFEPSWRDGTALLNVFRQKTYGGKFYWHFFQKNKLITQLSSISVLVFECLFILAFFMPIKFLFVFLFFGFVFHLMVAVIMGLNHFPWAFVGSYPAVFWTAQKINLL